jgi:hypothetical protein
MTTLCYTVAVMKKDFEQKAQPFMHIFLDFHDKIVSVVTLTGHYQLHYSPLRNATISNIRSNHSKALQKLALSNSFETECTALEIGFKF